MATFFSMCVCVWGWGETDGVCQSIAKSVIPQVLYLPCLYGRVSYWPAACPKSWAACPTVPRIQTHLFSLLRERVTVHHILICFVFWVFFFPLNDGSRDQTLFFKFSKTSALSAGPLFQLPEYTHLSRK